MKWRFLSLMIVLFLLLTGCNGIVPEQELFVIYERAAEIEEDFEEHGQRIVELEQNEAELYKQIIQNGKKSNQDVQAEIEEALASITERKKLIEEQLRIITAAYEETEDAASLIQKIGEEEIRKGAQQAQELYALRVDSFIEFAENYQLTIQLEKQLYTELKGETQDLREIEDKVSGLNEEFHNNESLKKVFSDLSSQLNEAKKEFYQMAEIPIE